MIIFNDSNRYQSCPTAKPSLQILSFQHLAYFSLQEKAICKVCKRGGIKIIFKFHIYSYSNPESIKNTWSLYKKHYMGVLMHIQSIVEKPRPTMQNKFGPEVTKEDG